MNRIIKYLTASALVLCCAAPLTAQESQAGAVRRTRSERNAPKRQDGSVVTERMQNFYSGDNGSITDADRQWMRIIYRELDLDNDRNAALYFPEEPVNGQENLFRIIMRLLTENRIPAYEYLDGREIFTDQYRIRTKDILDRFYIPYSEAKGSTEKNPRFTVDENDVPTNEVLSYYVIERWEYDTRNNRLRPSVEAICPLLHRSGDFGGDALKYPMFWVRFSDIRPYLAAQTIFVDDDNNLPSCTYDDFFTLMLYDGNIYKTRNLKNKSMVQIYSDPDALKKAQDSIQTSLDNFEKKLWVPSREEVLAARERADSIAGEQGAASVKEQKATSRTRAKSRSTKRSTKEPKVKKSSGSSSGGAVRSVRRRK